MLAVTGRNFPIYCLIIHCRRYTDGLSDTGPNRDGFGRYTHPDPDSSATEGKDPMARTRIPLSKAEEASRNQREKLELSTAEIGLTVRTTNCLEERGIFTVRDLLNCRPEDLLGISNFGEKTLEEVYKALEEMGFRRVRPTAEMGVGV